MCQDYSKSKVGRFLRHGEYEYSDYYKDCLVCFRVFRDLMKLETPEDCSKYQYDRMNNTEIIRV